MMQDAQNARSADKLARVESALADIAEKLLKVLQTFTTGEHVVRLVGQTSAPAWVFYDRDYISGDFDFEVEAGSTQPQNESFRRQSALQMMDAMAPLAPVLDLPQLAMYVLQYGFGVKNPGTFVVQPPQGPMPPGQQQGAPPPQGELPPGQPPMEQAPPAPMPAPPPM